MLESHAFLELIVLEFPLSHLTARSLTFKEFCCQFAFYSLLCTSFTQLMERGAKLRDFGT